MEQVEDLKRKVVELSDQVETLSKEIEAQDEIIVWLRAQLRSLVPNPTVELTLYYGNSFETQPLTK